MDMKREREFREDRDVEKTRTRTGTENGTERKVDGRTDGEENMVDEK